MWSFLSMQKFMTFILLLSLLLVTNQMVGMTQASHDLSKIEPQKAYLGESANFELAYSVSSLTATSNDLLTYQITITAFNEAINISLNNALPTGLTYVANSATNGATFTNNEIQYTGLIQPDIPFEITYQAKVKDNLGLGSILYSVVEASGAGINRESGVAVAIPDSQDPQPLVLLYVNGDNDLSDYMLQLANAAEKGASNANITALLLLDGPNEGDTYLYRLEEDHDGSCPTYNNQSCDGRYELGTNMWQWHENIASPHSLAQFLIGAQHAYPNNNKILLSLVGHGGGWNSNVLPGRPAGHAYQSGALLWDKTPNNALAIAELGQALATFYEVTNRQIDLLYLDACLMSMSSVAYEVRDYVKYLLASESWGWTVFRYDQHLEKIRGDMDASQIGKLWLENEAKALRHDKDNEYPFTYSLLDLSQMTALREAQDQLAEELMAVLPDEKDKIDTAFSESACFDSNGDHYIVQPNSNTPAGLPLDTYCDLDSFARQIESQFSEDSEIVAAAQSIRQVIDDDDLVLFEEHYSSTPSLFSNQEWNWSNLGGISTYLPLIEDDWRRRYYNSEELLWAKDGLWDDFLTAYWSENEPPIDPECPPEGCGLPEGPLPTVPINLRVWAGAESINLRWRMEDSLETEFNRYQILRNEDGGNYSVIASSLNTQYSDADAALRSGLDYCYQIQALDSANQVIAASNITCAELGELTLWIPDQVAPANNEDILVPISLENGNDLCIGATDITVSYDSTVVAATGTVSSTIYTEGYNFIANTTQAGQVKIAMAEICEELYGGGNLFLMGFDVIGAQDQVSPLDFITGLNGTVIYAQENLTTPVELALSNGLLTVGDTFIKGDLNGDGTVNSADGAVALQFASLVNIPTEQQIMACDINGDEACNSADATLILCYAAYQDWDECLGSRSVNRLLEAGLSQNGLVQVGINPTPTRAGGTFVASVVITNGLEFSGGEFTFTYDASRMVPTGVSLTSLTNDFIIESNRLQPGILKVAMADDIAIESDGVILELHFKSLNGTSNIQLASGRLNDVTGRDFELSALQRDLEFVPYTGGTISIFLPTIIR